MIIKVNEFYKLKDSYIQVLSITLANGIKTGAIDNTGIMWSASVQFYLNGQLQSAAVGLLTEIPKVAETKDETEFWTVTDIGNIIELKFPGQDGVEFACAIKYAEPMPEELIGREFKRFVMVHQGCNDGDDWVWYINVGDSNHWVYTAWCDYTGWDCRSGGKWYKLC
jgi:hypothetical protein